MDKTPPPKWIDERDGSRLKIATVVIVIHRWVDLPDDHWAVTCFGVGIDRRDLGPGLTLDEAKHRGLTVVKTHLDEVVAGVRDFYSRALLKKKRVTKAKAR